jgi:SAM-dependent methyltransferase
MSLQAAGQRPQEATGRGPHDDSRDAPAEGGDARPSSQVSPALTGGRPVEESSHRPGQILTPDLDQLGTINALHTLAPSPSASGWRGRLVWCVHLIVGRLLGRQREFNAAVSDHLNRNAKVTFAILDALGQGDIANELRRERESLLARDHRVTLAIDQLVVAHEELRTSIGALQHATQSLKRQIEHVGTTPIQPSVVTDPAPYAPATPAAEAAPPSLGSAYVGFEDQFRGSQADIRGRLLEYVPIFAGAADVLDIGCGRGEFLTLLQEHGITGHGIDINSAMVDVCREKGLDAVEADALAYLRGRPDSSLGGLLAAQVVEHLEPRYLAAFLDTAFVKLRPGSAIVLETINPACWFAFFESYIRDVTHVRALHPDTLKYLLTSSGFQRVEIRYRAPYPEREKLQHIAAAGARPLTDVVEVLNANVDKINGLLFTWLDYAAIGTRP